MSEKKGGTNVSNVFKTVIWPKRKILLVGLVLIILNRLSALILPWKSKSLVDEVIPGKNIVDLYNLLVVVVTALLIQAVTAFLLTRTLGVQAHDVILELRTRIQKKVLSLPISFFDGTTSGGLASRIMNDVRGIRNLIGTGLIEFVGAIITAVVAMVLLIKISPLMTLFAFLPVSVFGFVALKTFKHIRPIFRDGRKIDAKVSGRLTETLAGVRVIKGFNAEKHESNSFKKGAESLFFNTKKVLTSQAILKGSSIFLIGMALVSIMGVGGYLMINGKMTIGEFLFFSLLLGYMVNPVKQISELGSLLTEAFAGLDRTEELMNITPEEEMNDRNLILEELKGDVEFNNVSFFYQEGKKVLHDINFKAKAGSVVALVGSSGSGKSTIAALSASFLNPQSGTVTIDGKDLSKIKLSSFRKYLGVVLQEDFLFEGSIRENILFPNPKASEEELDKAVKAGYVNEFTDRFEKGLDTLVGERGVKLSGGQRQRINIARAILANPKLIILDEATSNLDTRSEALIQKSLSELIKDRTSIVIAHRLSTIKKADQILVVEAGKIVEQGNHDNLIKKQGKYYELFTYQSKI
ncbi:MAG: ABC transporter ATP-binding protein [Bacteroidota bacterium]